jgi:tripartite-type tricarboxylate transporter receptor subunit TctC
MRAALMAVACAICAICAVAPAPAEAQAFPSKPVRMIVGFPPGGGTDILARIVAQKLSDAWGQPVVVENRPGASATIAAAAVAQAPADGYTLSMGQLTPNAIAPALMAKLPYNASRDFVPVVLVGTSPNVLVVGPSVAARDIAELVAFAKAKPAKLTYASSGTGSLQHIAAEVFKAAAAVDIVHVPFKGSGQAVIDLIAGNVDMNFDSIPAVVQHVKSGKLRAIGVTSKRRASGLPDVPAIAESGYPDYDLTSWWGIFAPAGTPPDVVARIHRDTVAALQNAEVKERFAALSVDPGGGSSREFAAYVAEEIAKYDALVKRLGIKAE